MFARIGTFILVISFAVTGSAQTGGSSSTSPDSTKEPASASGKTPPGMNNSGEVIDASKVERGYGQKVKGRDDLTVAAEFVRHVRNTDATDPERELLEAAFTAARDSAARDGGER